MSATPSPNKLTVKLAAGPYLTINVYCGGERINATLHMDEHPLDGELLFCASARDKVRVPRSAKAIWLGDTAISLAWNELLQVADFLHLDIPQPELPAGQVVPR
jgi:hypothetical protein